MNKIAFAHQTVIAIQDKTGMANALSGICATQPPVKEIIKRLNKDCNQLLQIINESSGEAISQQIAKIEGWILGLVTLSRLTDRDADELIDNLCTLSEMDS